MIAHQTTFVAIGHFNDPNVITACVTLVLAVILFIRNVQGGLLISILIGTGLAYVLGAVHPGEAVSAMEALRQYGGLFGELSLVKLADIAFWIAVFCYC